MAKLILELVLALIVFSAAYAASTLTWTGKRKRSSDEVQPEASVAAGTGKQFGKRNPSGK